MKKILFLLFVSLSALGQRNGLIDADTTTRPKAATFCGTKAQKLAAIGNMMAGYGITIKPNQ